MRRKYKRQTEAAGILTRKAWKEPPRNNFGLDDEYVVKAA